MQRGTFRQALIERGAVLSAALADAAIDATLRVLGQSILDGDRRALLPLLPAWIAEAIGAQGYAGELDLAELFAAVSDAEEIEPGLAMEHVEAVCSLLAEGLAPDALTALRARLPSSLLELFERVERGSRPPHEAHHRHRKGATLAEGRPGSAQPLSERHPDRAHAESVARAPNPHAGTKLSSGQGMTQEREHDSLAEGDPRSAHPLSEGDES